MKDTVSETSPPKQGTEAPDFARHAPDLLAAFAAAQRTVESAGLDLGLTHLVRLRASQVNGCAFCVKMHTRDARDDGESDDRLDRLVVWAQVDDYSPAERAALAWTEALTRLPLQAPLAPLHAALLEHFGPGEVAALTAEVTMINLWNRVAISRH